MDVILTHEQADFDALASLLCAHLLNEKYIPVLPNRVNRNVRNFLNLYGADFPFTEVRDLTEPTVRHITLVDTQSLVTLKGINNRTSVEIIDHHEMKNDLPVNWVVRTEPVGATTTILVDLLRDSNNPLSGIEATLLLLGIYEDTGSLSYASTTVRDVKATAFLLESGADLRIASEFLNPALSERQKQLADRLLDQARTVSINGKTILISCVEARDMNEEISSIAHKLRDLLDPDALFLFVHTVEGIRLVARSTSDQVDVARIAQHFGGGGHERAAAALIQVKDSDAEPVEMEILCYEVAEELKKNIQPPLTINKIMSRKPHVISPSTSLEEASKLMQRYGYEGYPVVENDKVVGLLTRRAVDRAQHHKLNLKAGSLMEGGDHSIKNTDTIDQLQQLMAATGWGQIPVLEAVTGKIIGIVTRTDLLKTLPGHNGVIPGQNNYAAMLEKALPPSRLALLKLIANFSGEEPQSLYIVGGFVRDLILERPSQDFDIVVEGDALPYAHGLARKFGGRVISHKKFNTAKWQIKDIRSQLLSRIGCADPCGSDLPDALDFISARTEFYDHPTALPTVERSSIKLDLHRRDFTINTLALRLDGHHYGELYDYWGGMADLEKKLVRVLHSLSFVDDPTRLLRAVRFEQRFNFQIENRTLQLMMEARELLEKLSGERIHHEFDLIFNEVDPISIMRRLSELDLLKQIHPRVKWDVQREKGFSQALNYAQYTEWKIPATVGNTPTKIALAYLVWLGQLDSRTANEIAQRLRLAKPLSDTLVKLAYLIQISGSLAALAPSRFTLTLDKVPVYGIFAFYCISTDQVLREKLEKYIQQWRYITTGVNGDTLRTRGVPPGPRYAQLLAEVRNAWLDGVISSTNEEQVMVDRLLKEFDD